MALKCCGGTCQSGNVVFENGTTIVVVGANGQRSEIGTPSSNDPAVLNIDSGAVFTYNDTRSSGQLFTGSQSIIEIDGGTMNGVATNFLGLVGGAVIRGNGGTMAPTVVSGT